MGCQSDGDVPVAYQYDNTLWTRYDIVCPNDRPRTIEDCGVCYPCVDKEGNPVLGPYITPDADCICDGDRGDPGAGRPPTPEAGPCNGGDKCSPACIGPLPFGVDVYMYSGGCGQDSPTSGPSTPPEPERRPPRTKRFRFPPGARTKGRGKDRWAGSLVATASQ